MNEKDILYECFKDLGGVKVEESSNVHFTTSISVKILINIWCHIILRRFYFPVIFIVTFIVNLLFHFNHVYLVIYNIIN